MAKFNTAVITNKGKALITKAQAGLASIQFSKIATGNGSYTGSENLESAVELKTKKQEFPISSLSIINENQVSLKSVISNTGLETGYYIKEIGLYAVDPDDGIILYSITTAVLNQWDYLPAYGSDNLATISLEISSTVSNTNTVSIVEIQGVYALAEDLQQANIAIGLKLDKTGDSKDNVSTFTQSATLAVINTGEKHSVMFGKIKKAIADLISHIGNTTNPHSVTKTQVGLGSVDNTADINKPVSTLQQTALDLKLDKTGDSKDNITTFTQAGTLANIATGEKHSVILGKVAKAIADFITHKNSTTNPHTVTKTQAGLGSVDNTADADKPVSTLQQTALDLKLDKTGDSKDNVTTFSQAGTLANISTGEKHSVIFSKVAKAIADFITHKNNITTNPHAVTKANVGLGNCDNTSDANKPVSTAQQTALNLKLDKTEASTWVDIKSFITINKVGIIINYALYNQATKEVKVGMAGGSGGMANDEILITMPVSYRPTSTIIIQNGILSKIGTDLGVADWLTRGIVIATNGTIRGSSLSGLTTYYPSTNFSYIVR